MLRTKTFLNTILAPTATAAEGIFSELFFVVLNIPDIMVMAAIGTLGAGLMLLAVHKFWRKKKITILPKEWKNLLIIAALFAATEFLWFDAVANIGSGRTALLNTPLEPMLVLVIAFFVLKEKLRKIQIFGSCIAIAGVIISIDVLSSSSVQQPLGHGEVEAILAALTTSIHYVLVARLLYRYDTLECTAFVLILSGLMLNMLWVVNPMPIMELTYLNWFWVFIFSFVPMLSFLIYYRATEKIGASLSAIACTGSILLILILQLVILQLFGVPLALPGNLTLAVMGGIVSIIGIYVAFCSRITTTKTDTVVLTSNVKGTNEIYRHAY